MIKQLPLSRLEDWFALISREQALYLPLEEGDHAAYGLWSPDARLRLDDLNTNKSPKDLFFPQSENLVAFKAQGKTISVIDNRKPAEVFVLFGVRACDAASLDILDRVFLSEPVDSYYAARREAGTVITRACFTPEETCFCGAFGIDAMAPAGDIATCYADSSRAKKELGWEAKLGLEDMCRDSYNFIIKNPKGYNN